MISSPEISGALSFIEEYPSPTKKEKLNDEIEEIRNALLSPPKGLPSNKVKIKLADLLVGRNAPGDYIEAGKIYDEVLSKTLPSDADHSKAVIGKAELSLASLDPKAVNLSVEECASAVDSLEGVEDGIFFFTKGKLILAELFLKRGDEEGRRLSLKLYDEISSEATTHKYFKIRALVGKMELLNYFYKDMLKGSPEEYIAQFNDILSAKKNERAGDYFALKGMIVLSEILLSKDREHFAENAKRMLSEVINNESSSDDLRARASLDLAEVSSPGLARALIKGVRKLDGLDPYILRKAKAIEEALTKI